MNDEAGAYFIFVCSLFNSYKYKLIAYNILSLQFGHFKI